MLHLIRFQCKSGEVKVVDGSEFNFLKVMKSVVRFFFFRYIIYDIVNLVCCGDNGRQPLKVACITR